MVPGAHRPSLLAALLALGIGQQQRLLHRRLGSIVARKDDGFDLTNVRIEQNGQTAGRR